MAPCEDSRLRFNPRAGNPTLSTNARLGVASTFCYLSVGQITIDRNISPNIIPFFIEKEAALSRAELEPEQIAADAAIARWRGAGEWICE